MSTRLYYLDSSRGLAALIVLITHFQTTILPQICDLWIYKTPLRMIIDGQAAVLYFFILSGYVLTLSIQNSERLSIYSYIRFVMRRVFRIFPAFLFTLLLTFAVIKIIETRPPTWLSQFWITVPGITGLLKQALLVIRLPNDPVLRLIPQDWTLSIEIAISLLLPALAFASQKKSFFVIFFVYVSVQFLGLDPFVFDFSLGVFLACNSDEWKLKWTQNRYKILLFVVALFLICTDYAFPDFMKYADIILIHHKIWGIAFFLWMIISSGTIQKILSVKPIIFLGKISYSFYLLHLIILFCMTVFFPDLNPLALLLLFVTITTIVSITTYTFIEKPFNQIPKILFRNKDKQGIFGG